MPAERGVPFGYWRDPVFVVCLAVYFFNREWIKPHLHAYSPFFHGHLNDSLLVPVALPLYLFVYRRLGLRPDDAPPRSWEIALHLVVWSLFFKWFGPAVLHRSVADPFDLIAYWVGGALAWLVWWPLPQWRSWTRKTAAIAMSEP
jgi:hypothetical protein